MSNPEAKLTKSYNQDLLVVTVSSSETSISTYKTTGCNIPPVTPHSASALWNTRYTPPPHNEILLRLQLKCISLITYSGWQETAMLDDRSEPSNLPHSTKTPERPWLESSKIHSVFSLSHFTSSGRRTPTWRWRYRCWSPLPWTWTFRRNKLPPP